MPPLRFYKNILESLNGQVLDPPLRRIWKQSLLFRRGRSRTGPTAYAPGALAREPMCRCGTAPAAIFVNPGPSGPMRASAPTKLRHKFTVRRKRTGPTIAPSSVWPNGQPPSPQGEGCRRSGGELSLLGNLRHMRRRRLHHQPLGAHVVKGDLHQGVAPPSSGWTGSSPCRRPCAGPCPPCGSPPGPRWAPRRRRRPWAGPFRRRTWPW